MNTHNGKFTAHDMIARRFAARRPNALMLTDFRVTDIPVLKDPVQLQFEVFLIGRPKRILQGGHMGLPDPTDVEIYLGQVGPVLSVELQASQDQRDRGTEQHRVKHQTFSDA